MTAKGFLGWRDKINPQLKSLVGMGDRKRALCWLRSAGLEVIEACGPLPPALG